MTDGMRTRQISADRSEHDLQRRCVVVIPARNEQRRLGTCLAALARQTIGVDAFETIVVVDDCDDDTAAAAQAAAVMHGLDLSVLPGPGAGVGVARRIGMDAAAERLLALGLDDGLIATTDADSCPAPDWLARQLAYVADGARAIAGLIELDRRELQELPPGVVRRRQHEAARRLARVRKLEPAAEHHHFAGASLGLTAGVYRAVGGLEPVVALEDARFEDHLRRHGIQITRAADVRVRTSARTRGRAARGLAVDLAVAQWLECRRYDAADFPIELLRQLKRDSTVTVIVPTRRCAETISGVLERTVGPLAAAGLVDELVVVDAGSDDGTASVASRSGARVLQQDELLREFGPALGKGDAMWRALSATGGDLVCFLDGDTANPDSRHLQGLLGPLLTDPQLQLVKGTFERPLRTANGLVPDEGGRVTEIMARPLLNLHLPQLAGFSQPLAGEFAARRSLLEAVPFPVGYGVEIAILIDALRAWGLEALAESQLGERHNRHQPLRRLGEMAYAVLAAVERRLMDAPGEPAGRARPALGGDYLRPWEDGAIAQVPVVERPPLGSAGQPLTAAIRS